MKTEALKRQSGGTHYKVFAVEPLQFGMRNDWDFCATSMVKYITRHRLKGGLSDIEKAIHYVDIRLQLYTENLKPTTPVFDRMTMTIYCNMNRIEGLERNALLSLEKWVDNPGIANEASAHVKAILGDIASSYVTQHERFQQES